MIFSHKGACTTLYHAFGTAPPIIASWSRLIIHSLLTLLSTRSHLDPLHMLVKSAVQVYGGQHPIAADK